MKYRMLKEGEVVFGSRGDETDILIPGSWIITHCDNWVLSECYVGHYRRPIKASAKRSPNKRKRQLKRAAVR